MLQYEISKKLYEEMKAKAAKSRIDGLQELFQTFLKTAVRYANTRTDWSFMSRAEQIEADRSRTIKHDSVISLLTAVCRNLEIDGVEELLPDRKTKGDFACFIALFLALEQR